jgi:hypothetical protein
MNWDIETIMEDEQQTAFVIDNDQKANWAIQKISEIDADYERMCNWYQEQMSKLEKQRDIRIERLTAMLRGYFATVPKHETKTMSKYALPCGELIYQKPKKDFVVEDTAKLLVWAIDNSPTDVKIVSSPAWGNIKKRLKATEAGIVDTETGVVVDGVVQVEKPDEFKVKLAEGY